MPNGGASIDRKTPPQVPSTRMPYGRKDGSSESPVRNTSTARGATPALAHRAHDERLAAARVAAGKDAGHRGRKGCFRAIDARLRIAAGIGLDAEGLERRSGGMHEAHGEQHALTGNLEGGIGHLGRREAAVRDRGST